MGQIIDYLRLMRFDKPIGTLLVLWPTLWGLWLANDGHPSLFLFFIFFLGTIIMRAAGCIINDFADRNFDKHVERTRNRPITSGKISPRAALTTFAILLLFAFILVMQLNYLTVLFGFIGVFIAVIYPFLKRWTHLPQVWLGFAFTWGVPMAYTASIGTIPAYVWILFTIGVIWSVIYDTQYAIVDRDDDLKIGIGSTAILFGHYDRLIIGILQSLWVFLFVILGVILSFKWPFYCALIISTLFFIYQQYLTRNSERAGCFTAFKNNQWIGLIIWLGIIFSLK
ncbi:MAG: 4-hydroxybenzoate octaprenyltransferase [Gammaproteobacteria bacterium]